MILPPGGDDYPSVRLSFSCLPYLKELGINEPSSSPCLFTLLQNIHHMIQDQHTYEEVSNIIVINIVTYL